MSSEHPHLSLSNEVGAALADGAPVVALESTIISHGMPYPRNVETALAVEDALRRNGATPATIAVLDGSIRVGLDSDEIERLASARTIRKVSRRDLAIAIYEGGLGGTTVAATMIAAAMAGIRIFTTGGIGGVHRGAASSFDISADLQELARTPVTVVCAGFKAILDLPLTLEYLETHGVPVVGFGTDHLPAFYTPDSGLLLDQRVDDADSAASLIRIRHDLGVSGGMVVANPIPADAAMDSATIGAAIDRAVAEASAGGIVGKETTPFLLDRVSALTGDASLESNIALVRDNARVAAAIAVALTRD